MTQKIEKSESKLSAAEMKAFINSNIGRLTDEQIATALGTTVFIVKMLSPNISR